MEPQSPPRAIGRGERARARVLRAALDVLAQRGVAGFSIEAVAEHAGASKATIYRHWPSQSALLVAAMDLTFQPFAEPATGTLRTDLVALIRQQNQLLRSQRFPALLAAFIEAAERDASLQHLHVELTDRRRLPLKRVLERARERGEIVSDADVELCIDLLTAPAFYRRFIAHRSLADRSAEAVVDYVLRAIATT